MPLMLLSRASLPLSAIAGVARRKGAAGLLTGPWARVQAPPATTSALRAWPQVPAQLRGPASFNMAAIRGVVFASASDAADLVANEARAQGRLQTAIDKNAEKFKLSPVDAKIIKRCVPRLIGSDSISWLVLVDSRAAILTRFRRMLDELGLQTPGQLRGFVTKRSLPVLAMSLFEALLNGAGSYAALALFFLLPWDGQLLINRGMWPWAAALLVGAGQATMLLSSAMFLINSIFSSITFGATATATLAFDINARGFLDAVQRRSGGIGMAAWDAPLRAAASVDVLRRLRSMHEAMVHRAVSRDLQAPPSKSLAVYIASLAKANGGGSLGLAALALAPAEAATLARLFARFDTDADDRLNVDELRALMSELSGTDVSADAATAAMQVLDVDGDGAVELDELAAWYGSSRLWHRGVGEMLPEAEMYAEEAAATAGAQREGLQTPEKKTQ